MARSDRIPQKETQGKTNRQKNGKEGAGKKDTSKENIHHKEGILIAMLIEVANAKDAQAILDLQKLAYQSEAAITGDYTIPPLVQSLEQMEQDFQKQVVLKATVDGKIVGSVRAYAQDRTCYIGRLIVHPDCQNQGLGKQILKAIEDHFGAVDRYELFTGEKSERNLYFYQKMGYRIFRSEKMSDLVTIAYMEKHRDPHI